MQHLEEGQLHALIDGELGGEALQAAKAHLEACEECRRRADEAGAFATEANALIEAIQVPAAGAEAVPRPRRLARYRHLALAATLVLAVGLGLYSIRIGNPAVSSGPGPQSIVPRSDGEARQAVSSPAAGPPPVSPAPAAAAERPLAGRETALSKDEAKAKLRAPERRGAVSMAGQISDSFRDANEVGNAAASTQPTATSRVAAEPLQSPAPAAAPRPVEGERDKGFQAVAEKTALMDQVRRDSSTRLTPIGMEEAVRRLAGAIRLIDGLTPIRIDGAERASIPTVRVVYPDAPGREIWLDQWRVSGPVEGLKEDRRRLERDLDLLPGDTLVTKDAERWTIRWLDGNGFRLSLSGQVGADSLKALARRVR